MPLVSPHEVKATPSLHGQPPYFQFGRVYKNSIIEASYKITDSQLITMVYKPSWIDILHQDTEWFSFRVDTSSVGDFLGTIYVNTTDGQTSVAVSITIRDSPQPSVRVLIADSPFSMWSTSNPEDWKTMTDIMDVSLANVTYVLHENGYYTTNFPSNIENYDIILLAEGGIMDTLHIAPRRLRTT